MPLLMDLPPGILLAIFKTLPSIHTALTLSHTCIALRTTFCKNINAIRIAVLSPRILAYGDAVFFAEREARIAMLEQLRKLGSTQPANPTEGNLSVSDNPEMEESNKIAVASIPYMLRNAQEEQGCCEDYTVLPFDGSQKALVPNSQGPLSRASLPRAPALRARLLRRQTLRRFLTLQTAAQSLPAEH